MPGSRVRRPPTGLALGLAVLVGAAGSAGVLYSARERSEEVERVPDLEEVLAANDGPAENFLLVGSDSREGVDTGDPEEASTGDEAEVSGQRSDTIMILRREKEGGASLLSLPRDLWVPIAGTDRSAKINSAYNEGPQRLARTVTESLGIPIHHYVEIDFHGFTRLVDEIGGVQICVENSAQDLNTGLRLNPGCQNLNGTQALAYARSRNYEEFVEGDWVKDPRPPDLGRIARQQEFIRTAVNKLLRQIRRQPFKLGELIGAATGAVRIDEDVDPVDAANALRGAAEEGLGTYTLPVEGVEREGQSALELTDGAEPILNYFRGIAPAPPTTTAAPG
jgi:LCP family protein required for cell wall assembly